MIERLKRGYEVLAFALLGFLVLLVLLNAAAWLVLALWDGLRPPRPSAAQQAVYPGLSDDEIRRLLEETWDGAWRYEPWVGFREEPRSGRFVNISPEGFRFNAERDRRLGEPGLAVYVFGGSTTFGYGVADGETIPSYLEEELRGRDPGEDVRVYNFGRGWYYSTQELVLLQQLLRAGHVPDVAVFLDGLNEGQPGPHYSREMAALESLADGTASFNLTDLLEGYEGQPFVDLAHYTPDVCRRIARAMGREIRRPGDGARR